MQQGKASIMGKERLILLAPAFSIISMYISYIFVVAAVLWETSHYLSCLGTAHRIIFARGGGYPDLYTIVTHHCDIDLMILM